MEVLWEEAFRTRVVSSEGVISAIERKCRGAKGDVRGVEGAGLEYERREALVSCCRATFAGWSCVAVGILNLGQLSQLCFN
jgi:hypothetical protein